MQQLRREVERDQAELKKFVAERILLSAEIAKLKNTEKQLRNTAIVHQARNDKEIMGLVQDVKSMEKKLSDIHKDKDQIIAEKNGIIDELTLAADYESLEREFDDFMEHYEGSRSGSHNSRRSQSRFSESLKSDLREIQLTFFVGSPPPSPHRRRQRSDSSERSRDDVRRQRRH